MSVLAGFVDPGESLEQAVHREVFEESGAVLRPVPRFRDAVTQALRTRTPLPRS